MHSFFNLNLIESLIVMGFFTCVFCYWLYHWTKQKKQHFESAKVLDAPERWSRPKPNYGGILFFLAFCISSVILILANEYSSYKWLFAAAVTAFLLGLWDDLRRINPTQKFMGQFIAAGFMVAGGFRLGMFAEPYGTIISFFFVVALMNSFNMLDNMDAIATIVALSVFVLGFVVNFMGFYYRPFYAWILVSATVSFLVFNWHPSKIFMGDSGTMLLGVLMAGVFMHPEIIVSGWFPKTLIVLLNDHTIDALTMLALPIVDTTVVIINRVRHGVSPFQGGKDHTTHNLVYLGLREKQVALVFVSLSLLQLFLVLFSNYNLKQQMISNGYALRTSFDWISIVYILLLFLTMLLISFRNLRKGKYSYSKK